MALSRRSFYLGSTRVSNNKLLFVFLIGILLLFPTILLKFPPATDLPQHIAQVRLFFESLKDSQGPYQIQWYAPNNLIYFVLGIAWKIFEPENVGRVTMAFIVLVWLVAIYFLAAKRNRALDNAALASMVVFNHALYWGFLNFLIGWPVFVVWFLFTTADDQPSLKKQFVFSFLISFLLYESHALWFALGVGWLVLIKFIKKTPKKIFFARTSGLIPCFILSLMWYPSLSSSRATAGFDVSAHWSTWPFERLNPTWLVNAAFGGVRGYMEGLAFSALLIFGAAALWLARKRLKWSIDRDLLLVAGFFFAIAFFAPDKYMNTIYFSSRWLPCGMILLLLSLPAPDFNKTIRRICTIAIVVLFSISTALTWLAYNTEELAGLESALKAVPLHSRIVGLDFVKESQYIKNRPFLQLFAYAQVMAGSELDFSFAEHSSGIVRYKTKRIFPWTPGLEWFPERLRKSDLQHFDYALVNGNAETQKIFLSIERVTPLKMAGRWHLYKLNH